MVVDEELTIQYLNESAENLIHRSRKQANGKPLSTVLEVDSVLKDSLGKCLKSESIIRLRDYELSLLLLLETRRIDCQLTPIKIHEFRGVIVEVHEHGGGDGEYQIRGRQESGQALIKGIAHEIRNPLGGIRGAAQLLAGELDGAGIEELGWQDYTDVIIREVDRLSALVDRMQSSAKAKAHEAVNIHGILEHVRQLVNASLPEQISIKTDYDPSLPPVWGDETALIQVMINLVQNSIEAIDGQGVVIFQTRIDRRVLNANTQQQVIKVSVEDDGRGIDEELIRYVFEPLVTTKAKSGGLGLAITSQIIRQHGGLIDVQSEEGKTVFHLYLPIAGDAHA